MSVALQVRDGLLPVRCQDILVLSGKALVYLAQYVSRGLSHFSYTTLTFAHGPVYSSAGAKPCDASCEWVRWRILIRQ